MKFLTHAAGPIDVRGTFLQGTLQATRQQLVTAFGEPLLGLTRAVNDWHIQFEDGAVATIYDWKTAPVDDAEVYAWRIGGKSREDVERVHQIFREQLGLGRERRAA